MNKQDAIKELERARKKVAKWSEKRFSLPPGSSRAKVTTANARWIAACEHEARMQELVNKTTAA